MDKSGSELMDASGWNKPTTRSRLLPLGLLAIVVVAALIASGTIRVPGVTPAATPAARPATGSSLLSEYGGSASVYSEIAVSTDCDSLQETFDRAGDNNDLAQPGSPEHKWTLGYMKAADDRMRTLGCY